ncbi:hypothetical protein IL992_43940 [Microbispora sp. NEAU-D428]|uniref:hypothetical protein n=1 Tax=Microbispora sitophila TaxID=2771537 RepID=UPI0018660426|nr:hypothetical protein [Microbispora sitophila]MBE3016056.1 hypothetical protein [Microbispora sitophila]
MGGLSAGRWRCFTVTAVVAAATTVTLMGTTAPASAARTTNTVLYGATSGPYPDLGIAYWASENADQVSVEIPDGGDNRIVFHDPNASSMSITDDGSVAGTLCTLDDPTTISCPKYAYDSSSTLRIVRSVSIIGWAGADHLSATGDGMIVSGVSGGVATESTFTPIKVTLSGWEGDDVLTSTGGYSSIAGGPGDDSLSSGPGKPAGAGSQFVDSVDGGPGNDTIDTSSDNSPDADAIHCDDQADVVPDPDTYLSDSLTRSGNDTVYQYYVPPSTYYPSGCDTVTTS